MMNFTAKVLAVIGLFTLLNIAYEFVQESELTRDLALSKKNKLLASSSKQQREKVKNTTTTEMVAVKNITTSETATDPCDPKNFLILIKAGATQQYQERRIIWRNSTCPDSYSRHNMQYKFMLAMPAHENINPNTHNQGARASDAEIADMKKLEHESLIYGDMQFLSMKDVYSEFSYKTLRILEWAVDRGMTSETSIVVLHDDEYCIRPQVLQKICNNVMSLNCSLYAGNYLWDRAYYDSQKGFDGTFAPYFSGHVYALSTDLVRSIVVDQKSYFTSENVNYSEDLQVGRWVMNQISGNDDQGEVKYVTETSLVWNVEKDEEKVKIEDEHQRKGAKRNNTVFAADGRGNKNNTLLDVDEH